jgi:hypothetical protein
MPRVTVHFLIRALGLVAELATINLAPWRQANLRQARIM